MFLNQIRKKIMKVTRILPGKKKTHNGKKRACKLNTSSFFLSHIFTNVLKSCHIYKISKKVDKTSYKRYVQVEKLFTSLPPSRQEQNTSRAKAVLVINSSISYFVIEPTSGTTELSAFDSRGRAGGRDDRISCRRTDG